MSSEITLFESIIINSLEIPGVKVDREKFLYETLSRYETDTNKIDKAIETNTIDAGLSKHILDKSAKYSINKTTALSSGASFLAGLPGGFTMLASVPADVIQYFAMSIRLAQEIAYIYGEKDLYSYIENDDKKVREVLTAYVGVMFGVQGASELVKLLSSQLSKTALKKIPRQALTKTFYYPIIKKIGSTLSIKVTKNSFAKGVSKTIPIVGGVISGTMTFFSLRPMGKKLQECLSFSKFNYDEDSANLDFSILKNMQNNDIITDATYREIEDTEEIEEPIKSVFAQEDSSTFKISDEIKKFKELINRNLITQEEATQIKEILLRKSNEVCNSIIITENPIKINTEIDIVNELKKNNDLINSKEIDEDKGMENKANLLKEYYNM